MSRKKLKRKKKQQRDADETTASLLTLDDETRKLLQRGGLWATVICALAIAIYAGFGRLSETVHAFDRYDRRLALEWVDLPDWLKLRDNRHILDSLTRQVDLRDDDRLLDPMLAERLGRSLSEPDVGWIKSVDRVTLRPNGVVSIRCQFRRPMAWVRHGMYCYLVDEEGARLPGRYDTTECRDSSLLMVIGVRAGPPSIGDVWRGADLSSGLRLVSLLAGNAFRHQIDSVAVLNHDGRLDHSRPHLELVTDRRGSRIWWGRPPDEEHGTEITAAQKITLLNSLYRQWGRIDMNRSYVNIMTWPDKVAMPAVKRSPRPARLLRG